MNKTLLAAIVIGAAGLAWAPHARADLLSIGYATSTSGTPTTLVNQEQATALPTTYSNADLSGWDTTLTVQGTPPLPQPELSTTTIDVSPSTAGTLVLYVTEQDISGPLGTYNMLSSFDTTALQGDITSITEATYIDTGNGQFTTSYPLSTTTFTASGAEVDKIAGTPDLTGPYSITEVFTIDSTGTGNLTAGIETSDVPEPGSLALLGTGLFALGLVGWTRRRRDV